MDNQTIPLFPLHTVLFPASTLALRLFEPRYLDMLSACIKAGTDFGVCLICDGAEAGTAAASYPVGTLAKITDWYQRDDGLLGITVCGQQRFTIRAQQVEANQLIMAGVELLPNEAACEIPACYLPLVDLLRQALEQPGQPYFDAPKKYADGSWVSYRLAEILPLKLSVKQDLLELNDALQRLERLYTILAKFDFKERL